MNQGTFLSAYRAVTANERSARLRLFTAAIGVIALKDLQNHEVLRGAVELGAFAYPYVRLPLLDDGRWLGAVLVGSQLLGMIAALLLVAQRHVRPAALCLLGLYGYPFLVDRLRYTNNGYLLLLMLGLVALANADARPRTPSLPGSMGRVLVSVIYLTAAAAKLDPDWFSGQLMEASLRHYHYVYAGRVAFYDPTLFRLLAFGTIGAEVLLAIAPWLRHRFAWPIAAGTALVFHGLIELALPVRCFSYLMIASFLLSAPPGFLAPAVRLRWTRWPVVSACLGAGIATTLNALTAQLLGAYPLIRWHLALTLSALVVVAALLFLRGRGGLGRGPVNTPPLAITPGLRRVRAALLIGWTATHLALVSKPLFGGTNAFAWRMFTEDLKLELALSVRGRDAQWRSIPLPGATPWSSDGYLHHWSSWSEQGPLLERYASWLLERYPALDGVTLTVLAQTNEQPWRTHVITRTRTAPLAEATAPARDGSP